MFRFDEDLYLSKLGYTGDRDDGAIVEELLELLRVQSQPP